MEVMETQKILKPSQKTVVLADYREKEVSNYLRENGATVNEMDLEIGDFICSSRLAIERKTHSDFVSSIIDGRIFEQTENLLDNFEKVVIVVEGSSNRDINENAYRAALARILIDGVSIISTRNPKETAKTIYWIAQKEQSEEKFSPVFKVGKKPKDEKRLLEEVVASLPGISVVLSKRLLEHFGSIRKIFTADENELQKVKGVGKVLAKKIKKLLTTKY